MFRNNFIVQNPRRDSMGRQTLHFVNLSADMRVR